MAPPASPVFAMPQAPQPEQLPLSPRLTLAVAPAAEQPENGRRPLEVAECALCGVARPLGLLVPDGGPACTGIRWYCKDVKSCTERWTTAQLHRPDDALGAVQSVM